MSYKAEATQGFETECEDVLVYPNPVRESYQGPIAIRGLVKDADVKITDASGSLVYQTKALGGQAIWDGRNVKGQNLQPGVYFVFASNPDGSQGCSTKLVMFR
jgi:flagellar hook assembly protein FlgD